MGFLRISDSAANYDIWTKPNKQAGPDQAHLAPCSKNRNAPPPLQGAPGGGGKFPGVSSCKAPGGGKASGGGNAPGKRQSPRRGGKADMPPPPRSVPPGSGEPSEPPLIRGCQQDIF
ncbi:hypothetical protein M8J75_001927 [Diaphorina citri]|nr:hypothetical protein M8J75_001927 [Diaphorina citri]